MGGLLSVSLSCDQTVNRFSQWLCLKESYIHNLVENLESLKKAMAKLKAKRDDVQTRIYNEELTRRKRRLSQVQLWLDSVQTIENQICDLISTNEEVEQQRKCLCSFCSKDLVKRYRFGKSVVMKLKEVESLSSQGQFDVVTEAVPVGQAEEMSIQPTIVGQKTMLERVWEHFMKDEIGMVGLYGMGGVGKTTLLKQINNKFTEINGQFNFVIWVVVSNGATVYKIQEDIAGKLGLKKDEWAKKNENERAQEISNVLIRRKFALLLDDIWEKVNLEAIGVPYPSRENGCKIAFTTRSREVCGHMGVDGPLEVSCLGPEESYNLFEKKVGITTLESHKDIPELARKIVEKCDGLPLALNVIGETMACKRKIQEWIYAIDVLTSSAAEFSGMDNKILSILKYSYDNLRGEQVKLCFLFCSLYPEDDRILKESLIYYWIGEKFIDENLGIEKAFNQGYEILRILVRACLLEENEGIITMHDVVREMALWIASDFGKHKEQYFVKAGVGLREIPKVQNWRVVNKMSLMENKIEEIDDSPECPELTTLLLCTNSKLAKISGKFFWFMPNLLVLDLSSNRGLVELPDEISKLVSLRYLDLSFTGIKRLPLGLQELKILIHLNLEKTHSLESLEGISNLSNLMIFRLGHSNMMLDINLLKELEVLKRLEHITIDISPSMTREKLLYASGVLKCIQRYRIKGGCWERKPRILPLPVIDNITEIEIECDEVLEIKITKPIYKRSLRHTSFSNLSSVSIEGCNGLKDLTWLLFAPSLTLLFVTHSEEMESIISKEKLGSVLAKEDESSYSITPFTKLECVSLFGLPKLKSIYWSPLPFPCLEEIKIDYCPNLKKLPFDSESVFKIDEFFICCYREVEELKQSLEWEDEATRLRFLDSFQQLES